MRRSVHRAHACASFRSRPATGELSATPAGAGGHPGLRLQTIEVGADNGASVDFTIPEAGKFLLVDHHQLAHLPDGFVIPFAATP